MLTTQDRLVLFYQIAECARGNTNHRTLLESCIRSANEFSVFSKENEQAAFTQDFLETLLDGIDKKTFNWLDAQSKKWPTNLVADWKRYKSQRPASFSALITPSWSEQLQLWRERTLAFRHIREAIRSGDEQTIVRESTEYMTTLSSNSEKIPAARWRKIDTATTRINTYEDAEWKQHLSDTQGTTPLESAKRQTEEALRSRRVGRIVHVATEHMLTLNVYAKSIPVKQWNLINAAFDFFNAYEEADESSQETNEKVLIEAEQIITHHLPSLGYLVLRLTMHEKMRVRDAYRKVEQREVQRTKEAARALLAQRAADREKTAKLSLDTPSEKRPGWNFFDWLKQ